jgi:hypothetical protein
MVARRALSVRPGRCHGPSPSVHSSSLQRKKEYALPSVAAGRSTGYRRGDVDRSPLGDSEWLHQGGGRKRPCPGEKHVVLIPVTEHFGRLRQSE